ncbi:uncharacterized protein M6B38_336475 [Iris pallida]|uniref:Uncharacterized protein n=1 Tax=Iris pallida TaxID=29817 RepID=A0AAX6H0G1_IRIPA|nr:uncharacterized protein M6B38_336475 [Iris pallida]
MGSSSRAAAVGSPPAHPFEFPSFAAGEPAAMCAAGDVFSGGKLLPFCGPPPPPAATAGSLPSGAGIGAGYRKLRKEPDPSPDPLRRRGRRRKNRWYVLAFGAARVPAGMEMKEIRIRQQRMAAAAAEEEEWGPWKLLRSLSCRGVEVAGDCHRRIVL